MLHTVTLSTTRAATGPILYRASVVGHGRPVRRSAAHVLPPQRLRHRRVRHRLSGQLAGARAATASARSATSTPSSTTAGAAPSPSRNAICIHEEDHGILWKHLDWRTGHSEVRRSRRLVVSFIATVGNYEYGFYWYFYQDGTHRARGEADRHHLQRRRRARRDSRRGASWSRPRSTRPIHQHFFNVRLDMMVDGPQNSVYEVDTRRRPARARRIPHGNAFRTRGHACSAASPRPSAIIDPLAGRFWKIVNPSVTNRLGEPVGLQAHARRERPALRGARGPGDPARRLHDQAPVGDALRPARAVRGRRLSEPAPGRRRAAELRRRTTRRSTNADVVVWYTFGAHHVVRPEDWPVMPVASHRLHAQAGRLLRPQPGARRAPAGGRTARTATAARAATRAEPPREGPTRAGGIRRSGCSGAPRARRAP